MTTHAVCMAWLSAGALLVAAWLMLRIWTRERIG